MTTTEAAASPAGRHERPRTDGPVGPDGPADARRDHPVLDTLRAVGALCVLTTHAAFWAGDYTRNGAWGTFLARLDVGVAIFFVLSGFLLFRPWLTRAAADRAAPALRSYAWKRALRIVPTYVVAALLALALIEDNNRLGASDWASTLLLLDTYHGGTFPAGLTQMWSLAVEVAFYAVLPLLGLLLVGRRRRLSPVRVVVGLALMAATSVWWHLDGASWAGQHTSGSPLQWLPAYLTWFAVGMLLALVTALRDRGRWSRLTEPLAVLARQPGSCWVLATGLMLVGSTPLLGPTMLAASTPSETLSKHLLYAVVGFLVVLTGVLGNPASSYTRAMSHPAGRHLGWTSYGVFCLHLPVLHLVMHVTGWTLFEGRGPAIWLVSLLVSVAAAEVVYRVLERPAMRLKGLVRAPVSHAEAASTATSGTSAR